MQISSIDTQTKKGSTECNVFSILELAKFKDDNLRIVADSNSQIKLNGNKYYVDEGKKRYLRLATCRRMPIVKDAPGLEVIQIYNLLAHDQIVRVVIKNLV